MMNQTFNPQFMRGFTMSQQNRSLLSKHRQRAGVRWALKGCLCLAGCFLALPVYAQSPVTEATPATAAIVPVNLVRWTGSLPEEAGRTVEVGFALYQDQAGGLALWREAQTVKVGADGRYNVLLGATSAEGLPQNLFQAGEARWIEAKPIYAPGGESAGATAPIRSLLAAVPYAFKSVDAETLAGRAAADYVTHEDLQSAVAATVQAAANSNPEAVATVIGSGTSHYVPMWTGDSALPEFDTKTLGF
jgi:hypothetical protein